MKVAKASGVADAGLADIFCPSAARARLLFSAIINFAYVVMGRGEIEV